MPLQAGSAPGGATIVPKPAPGIPCDANRRPLDSVPRSRSTTGWGPCFRAAERSAQGCFRQTGEIARYLLLSGRKTSGPGVKAEMTEPNWRERAPVIGHVPSHYVLPSKPRRAPNPVSPSCGHDAVLAQEECTAQVFDFKEFLAALQGFGEHYTRFPIQLTGVELNPRV